jgi:hypothetical protein
VNRAEFQKLADLRAREAGVLLAAKCYDGAYYLAGYAVECALKECIARKTRGMTSLRRGARSIAITRMTWSG